MGYPIGLHLFICNTLTPQIKGKCSPTNLMFPFAPGQHHDNIIAPTERMMLPSLAGNNDVVREGGVPFL